MLATRVGNPYKVTGATASMGAAMGQYPGLKQRAPGHAAAAVRKMGTQPTPSR